LHQLCKLDEIAPESGKEVLVKDDSGPRYIALFLIDQQVKAYLNTCPHQGRSLSWAPDRFLFDKELRLVCPHHGACFDLEGGLCTSGPCEGASLTSVDIEVIDGMIFLKGSG